jgi:hypothetical protein
MSRAIDYRDTWYQEVAPRSFYDEDDLERTIIQNLKIIFPQFVSCLFKLTLFDPTQNKKNRADLAMVKTDYSEWYVIEVELGKHDKQHVIEQMTTFYNCNYSDKHAIYIHNQLPNIFDLVSLKDMIATKPPELMVIVNEPKLDWVEDLKLLRCKTCIFQIYKSVAGEPPYRINGEHPYIYTKFCHCKYQKVGSPYTVEVLDKDFLDSYNCSDGATLSIEYNGLNLQWIRQDDSNRVFLHCKHVRPPLDTLNDKYRLNYIEAINSFSFTKD